MTTWYVKRVKGDRTGWTRISSGGEKQAGKEAAAWKAYGWTCTTMPASPKVLATIARWEQEKTRRR